MTYFLGLKSRQELASVHPNLVHVVRRAISITTQDFSVHDGIRTEAEQRALVERGASKTMNSMHRRQPDGYGHAVDLVPYQDGKLRWEWPLIYPIAAAMAQASRELAVSLRWGGCWDQVLHRLGETPEDMKLAVEAYQRRHPGPDFIDGPHYELR